MMLSSIDTKRGVPKVTSAFPAIVGHLGSVLRVTVKNSTGWKSREIPIRHDRPRKKVTRSFRERISIWFDDPTTRVRILLRRTQELK